MKKLMCAGIVAGLVAAGGALVAAPQEAFWPLTGGDDTSAVAAPRLWPAWVAAADAWSNNVEIRDASDQTLLRSISSAEIHAICDWMSLGGGPDGPSGMTWSPSGRFLFILVHDDIGSTNGPSDVVLRYDMYEDTLVPFVRTELFWRGDSFPLLSAEYDAGKLYVGTAANGLEVYAAPASATTGTLESTHPLPDGGYVRGLAIDADTRTLIAANYDHLYRASLTDTSLQFTAIGSITGIVGIAFSSHYGGPGQGGLYVFTSNGGSSILHVPTAQVLGSAAFAPAVYIASATGGFDICATADGRLLTGCYEDARMISDNGDTRLSFEEWKRNEFRAGVGFIKSLIRSDGYVYDGDVMAGWSQFFPATPDAAGFAVLVLLASEDVDGDAEAKGLIKRILTRYAGFAAGSKPVLSADGIPKHWIDPATGDTQASWPDEPAVMSQMLLAQAAARALAHYSDDADIRSACRKILWRVRDWDSYLTGNSLYLVGLAAGGPDPSTDARGYHEGVLWAQLAGTYGTGAAAYSNWLSRATWPTAELAAGYPVSVATAGVFQPAFVSQYAHLLLKEFRQDASWQAHMDNLLANHAAWNDDHAPLYFTVFSAGNSKWAGSGYNADSITDPRGEVAHFPAAIEFSAGGDSGPAMAAYHAYRCGARQTFAGGAQLLYRRSSVDPAWDPNTAAIVDVASGTLALAELLSPGFIDRVLAIDLPPLPPPSTRWPNATDLAGGWLDTWFGTVNIIKEPWIYHQQHGWMYVSGTSASNGIWFLTHDMGWMFSSTSVYPNFYCLNRGSWMYYLEGSVNPRWFWNWNAGAWEAH